MLDNIDIRNVLFLDIETVPVEPSYDDLSKDLQKLWDKKAAKIAKSEDETPDETYDQAGIYAEFGKIICISVGIINYDKEGKKEIRLKSFYGDDERDVLTRFVALLNKHYNKENSLLCAHNGKEFDYPYMGRRILINGIKLPKILDIAGKKPWEVKHLDTMELWKFGDYKSYTSLNLLANVFGIPSPKDDIEGCDVAKVYWQDKDLERIVKYCQKDVVTVAQIFLKYRGEEVISEDSIIII